MSFRITLERILIISLFQPLHCFLFPTILLNAYESQPSVDHLTILARLPTSSFTVTSYISFSRIINRKIAKSTDTGKLSSDGQKKSIMIPMPHWHRPSATTPHIYPFHLLTILDAGKRGFFEVKCTACFIVQKYEYHLDSILLNLFTTM